MLGRAVGSLPRLVRRIPCPNHLQQRLQVDASLIRFIKGKGGSTQKQIEVETGAKIILPYSKEDNNIVIEGNTEESLTKASDEIERVLREAVNSPRLDYSHFISLPLGIHPDLVDRVQKFQNVILDSGSTGEDGDLDNDLEEDVSNDSDHGSKAISVVHEVENEKERIRVKIDPANANSNTSKQPISLLSELGIEESIFNKPRTIHLTILLLKLWNEDRLAAAADVLQRISSQVNDALDNRPVFIRLKGLDCMQGPPDKARVVYIPVEEIGGQGRLLRACQVIINAYAEAGLALEKDASQALKLHATLMNARHRKRKWGTWSEPFDARAVIMRYGSENWGDYLIREAHLSQRFKYDENGLYHCCAAIALPENMQV